MSRFANTLASLVAREARPPEAPMARPDAPNPISEDVTAPRDAAKAKAKVENLRADAARLAAQVRDLAASTYPTDAAGLRRGAALEVQLAETQAAADAAERALVESWVAAYDAARQVVGEAAVRAGAEARAARDLAEAPFKAAEAAEAASDMLNDRVERLIDESRVYRRRLDELPG